MSFLPLFRSTLAPFSLLLLTGLMVRGHGPEADRPFEYQHAHNTLAGHAHAGWESRYFSEGRDALDGDSLMTGSVELAWKHLAAGVWFGESPNQEYNELQLTVGVSQSVGDFEFYVGYTHYRFPFDNSYDHEFGAGVTCGGLPLDLELALDAYYSDDAGGYFAELTLSREFPVCEAVTLQAATIFGMNQGYVADGHDGANHLALQLGAEVAITESIAAVAHTTYSWGLDQDDSRPDDDLLIDFFHAGLGLQWSF